MKEEIEKVTDKFELILESKDLRVEFPEHFLAKYTTGFEKIFLTQGIQIKAFVLKSKK